MRKGGAGLDLPIAIGVLVASGELEPSQVDGMAFVGELGLDGSLRGVPGTVVLAEALEAFRLVVPAESADEAVLAGPTGCAHRAEPPALVDRLPGADRGRRRARRSAQAVTAPAVPMSRADRRSAPGPLRYSALGTGRVGTDRVGTVRISDLAEVRGQRLARRALEVAATGGHHLLVGRSTGLGQDHAGPVPARASSRTSTGPPRWR